MTPNVISPRHDARSHCRWAHWLQIALLGAAAFSTEAAAQEMAQGEANITARADVRMALESGPATNSTKLALIGGVVGGRLSQVRQCYRDVTQQRPEVQGTLRFVVTLEAGGGTVEITRDELDDAPLSRCVLQALRAAPLASVRPPGAAFVVLTFSNTAADGVIETRQRRAVEDAAEVTTNADGRLQASGQTEIGEVRFRVVGSANSSTEQVQAVHRGVRALIPELLDCRRKASRRYVPYGEIELALRVARSGRARARTRRNTVRDDRGQRCTTRAIQRSRFDEAARGAITVVVEFAARPGDPEPEPTMRRRRR